MREEKKSDKVIAIYRAIEELVAEGADLSSMRVSDIALRAGIGKGTTYEYFSSKEEMVVKAMIYLIDSMVKRILQQMGKCESFKEKFVMLLDEMEEKTKQRACIIKYLNMLSDMHLCEQMHDSLSFDNEYANPIHIIRQLISDGQKEGLISEKYPQAYIEMSMFSKVISFAVFLDEKNYVGQLNHDGIKEELYNGLCREFA